MEMISKQEHTEELIQLLFAVEKLIKSNKSREEILDIIEVWDHDLCLEMDFINRRES